MFSVLYPQQQHHSLLDVLLFSLSWCTKKQKAHAFSLKEHSN